MLSRAERSNMKLNDLINGFGTIEIHGDREVDITSLAYDSKKVKRGSMFIAVRGFNIDGNVFISDAIKKGAVAVMTDSAQEMRDTVIVRVPDVRKAMALTADRFYGSPQKEVVMTAVTGTNGKTTTAYMIKSIFDTGGMDCGLIGTIQHHVAGETIFSVNTTPEAVDIHEYLARMVSAQQNACVMEVSSHALVLSRVYGIQFRAAAFLNLSRDHLDFHGNMDGYLQSKSLLFSDLAGDSTAVINRDDANADHIIEVSRGSRIITFGNDKRSDIYPLEVGLDTQKTTVLLATYAGEIEFSLPIPGRVNVTNAMAATGIALACGFPKEVIIQGLESLKPVKGRYEIVNEGQDFTVIVDYAHTPDALKNILSSAKELTKGRLISVFGCGGDRDKGKRRLMGEISEQIADFTFITSDNPRTENPLSIISDIMTGISESYKECPDRKEAITKAFHMAGRGDTVVIAGKGHEDYQIVGTEKKHFDDVETAHDILRNL
ncbi:UDP-N-acetylmuramoyl-L-alanyl-D-glutamate--2,6-diaminopimelate ligase [Candidatus Latescibacterota bacterium]